MSETPQYPDAHIVIASQLVRDIKLGGGSTRPQLQKDTARLRTGLLGRNYIPGDKVNCMFRPLKFGADGALIVELYGGMLHGSDSDTSLDPHFHHPFHLDLKNPLTMDDIRGMSLEDLLTQHCNDVVVDDGGNAQNMAINLLLAGISGLRQKMRLTIFSSSDPLKRLPDHIRDQVQPNVQYHQIPDVPDRIAIQLPWQYDNGTKGTFGLTTEPAEINDSLHTFLKTRKDITALLKSADCFVACDLSFQELRKFGSPGRFTTIVNAATKWRSTIAAHAYGTDMVLPMNYKEAADVLLVIQHVGNEEELHRVKRVPFPSPLRINGNEIDEDSLIKLDEMLIQLTQYNPLHHRTNGLVAFNYPITFEEKGGLVVGTRNRRSLVAFTSTPEGEAEQKFIQEFGDPKEMNNGDIETMGAGDAAASMLAMFNAINPQEFLEPWLEGREKESAVLLQYAQTILLSAMSRIAGAFLIHTQRTHLANINLKMLPNLFSNVAKESLMVARDVMRNPDQHRLSDMKTFGIKVVTWNLGSMASSDGYPHVGGLHRA